MNSIVFFQLGIGKKKTFIEKMYEASAKIQVNSAMYTGNKGVEFSRKSVNIEKQELSFIFLTRTDISGLFFEYFTTTYNKEFYDFLNDVDMYVLNVKSDRLLASYNPAGGGYLVFKHSSRVPARPNVELVITFKYKNL